jgi:hypothetical protein
MKPSWLSMNEHRAFPFVDPDDTPLVGPRFNTLLPRSAIVDFACILGPEIESATISLYAISRAAGVLTFTFTGGGGLLTFTRPIAAPEFATSRASRNTTTGCGSLLQWEGSLTTGDLAELQAVLADGETLFAVSNALTVEPICVRLTTKTTVTSINLANRLPAVVTPSPGCSGASSAYAPGTIIATAQCLVGPLSLIEGYNCRIAQDARSNVLTLSGAPGAGDGVACSEVPRYPGEAPPLGSAYFSGGPSCDELISSINGVSASAIQLVPGTGVSLSTDIPHTLTLDVDGSGLSGCS